MPLSNRPAAAFFGTFWLLPGGCGSAVIAAAFPGGYAMTANASQLAKSR